MKLPPINIAALRHDTGTLIRLVITVVLGVALLLLARGLVTAWRQNPLSSLDIAADKPPAMRAKPDRPAPQFYPAIPTLPDLHQGYLFNTERSLAESGRTAVTATAVNVHEVLYTGSVIIGEVRKALLAFPLGQPAAGARRPGMMGQGSSQGHIQVTTGDTVGGYTVSEILPTKIVFKKSTELVEKHLNDSKKERSAPPARARVAAPPPTAPAPLPNGSKPAPEPATTAPFPTPPAAAPAQTPRRNPALDLPPPVRNAPRPVPNAPPSPPQLRIPSSSGETLPAS